MITGHTRGYRGEVSEIMRSKRLRRRRIKRLLRFVFSCAVFFLLIFNFTMIKQLYITAINKVVYAVTNTARENVPRGEEPLSAEAAEIPAEEALPAAEAGTAAQEALLGETGTISGEEVFPEEIPGDFGTEPQGEWQPDALNPKETGQDIPYPDDIWRETFYPVPATPPVNQSYFSDALFIGDSRVMGLMLYSGLTDSTFYTEKGANVSTLLTKPMVLLAGGEKITIPEALKRRTFSKIYIKMGLNELGWKSGEYFIEVYGGVIDRIRELQPEAIFYVQSILPVTRKKSGADKTYNNERINEFNELIKKMSLEKNLHYLDVHDGISDDEGALPDAAGLDGIHLNKEYCKIWLEFLKRHTIRDYDKIRL